MAGVSSAPVTIPSFTGLKTTGSIAPRPCLSVKNKVSSPPVNKIGVRASLKDVGVAVVATAASAMLASNAMAMEVLLGSDDGGLVFVPSNFGVPAGEKIVFKNNAAFPHNVMFYEDAVPPGVDVSEISMGEDELLESPGQTYSVTLNVKGSYGFYCFPHEGAGMVGTLTVN